MFRKYKETFLLGGLIALLIVVGLNFRPDELARFFGIHGQVQPQSSPTASPTGSPSPIATADASQVAPTQSSAERAASNSKANSEIFREIFSVVYMKEPTDRADFGNWVDTLNQGASFEGVYNGLTHSTNYLKLEEGEKGASAEALKVFGQELAILESELPILPKFESFRPVPLSSEGVSDSKANPRPTPTPLSSTQLAQLAESYSKQFVGASIFTLKRALGDEALKVINYKNQYREQLALWYSRWVTHTVSQNVDFGLPLRNQPDEGFHYKWVLENSDDRLKWEVLNRLHRMLNETNRS